MEVDKIRDCIVATLERSLFSASAATPPCSSTPDLSQLVIFFLSHLGPKEVESCSTHILQTTLKETLAMSNLQTSVRIHDPGMHPTCGPSPWCTLWRLVPAAQVLSQFSANLCTLLSTHLQAAMTPSCHCDVTAILHTFYNTWDKHIFNQLTQMVSELKLDSDPHWCHCLATVCVCLVASEAWHVLSSTCDDAYTRGRRESSKEWLHGGQLLGNLDKQFPSALYRKYQEWEEQEVGGAGELVKLVEGGSIFKSVDVLVAVLSSIATIAKGCGHQQLTDSVMECSLRLVNRSWQHIQQVWKDELPLHVRYASLSSLLHLYTFLQTYATSQDDLCADLLCTLMEQVSAVRDRLIQYHTQLCMTCILQDSEAGDWQNSRPFIEGERCSYSVQMWTYHMRSLQHDLYTYLPLEFFLLREEILVGVLGACLSHLASRYSLICPSAERTGLVLADVLVILACTAATLPHLHALGEQDHTPPSLSSVDVSCGRLLLVAGVLTCSLQQLEESLASSLQQGGERNADGCCHWLRFLESHVEHILLYGEPCAAQVSSPHLILPLHNTQYGFLLQALLSDGGALCLQLCSQEEGGVVSHLLEVLLRCPHSVWALSSLCFQLAYRETEDDTLSDVALLQVPDVRTLLRGHLGQLLCSHLLTKASSFHSNNQGQALSGWCRRLLDGLKEQIYTHLSRPLQALLYCMSGGTKKFTVAKLAKILVSTLTGCGLASDSSHPCYPLILPTLKALCFALDPNDLATSLPSHIRQMIQQHVDYHRNSLESLLDPPILPPSALLDPSTLANDELSECTLTEHTIAAGIIASDKEGLQALQTIHSALRNIQTGCSGCGFTLEGFDPMKEYKNVATLGTNKTIPLSQQNLMTAADHIDMRSVTEGCNHELLLTLIQTVRWEWHVKDGSELTPPDRGSVDRVNNVACMHRSGQTDSLEQLHVA